MSEVATWLAPPIDAAVLRERIKRFPRVQLGHFPTPLEACPRFSEALGGPEIWIKRDDCTGLAFGGNKTRHLEFTLGDALAHGADIVIQGAAAQSNHCRQVAAAAAKLGIKAALMLRRDHKSSPIQGNLLLDGILGAEVHLEPIEFGSSLAEAKDQLGRELEAKGHSVYVINAEREQLGALGYIDAFIEFSEQADRADVAFDRIVLCAAGASQTGLAFAARAMGKRTRILGIAPIVWDYELPPTIAGEANVMAEKLGIALDLTEDDMDNTTDYVGEDYGIVTPEGLEATRLLARTEGILLDPSYTSKAMAGLVDLVRKGRIGSDERVCFWHTGGTPALFAYAEEMLAGEDGAA